MVNYSCAERARRPDVCAVPSRSNLSSGDRSRGTVSYKKIKMVFLLLMSSCFVGWVSLTLVSGNSRGACVETRPLQLR